MLCPGVGRQPTLPIQRCSFPSHSPVQSLLQTQPMDRRITKPPVMTLRLRRPNCFLISSAPNSLSHLPLRSRSHHSRSRRCSNLGGRRSGGGTTGDSCHQLWTASKRESSEFQTQMPCLSRTRDQPTEACGRSLRCCPCASSCRRSASNLRDESCWSASSVFVTGVADLEPVPEPALELALEVETGFAWTRPFWRALASSESLSHFCCLFFCFCSAWFNCSLYSWLQSSKSCGFTSMKSFMALKTMPCIVLHKISPCTTCANLNQ